MLSAPSNETRETTSRRAQPDPRQQLIDFRASFRVSCNRGRAPGIGSSGLHVLQKMKAVFAGIGIGSAIGLYLSMFYLHSLWLPVTAIAVFVSGAVGFAFGGRILPSMIVSAAFAFLYFGIFWIPMEWTARTATTPEEHFKAARALGPRAQVLRDEERSFNHYQLAAQGDHPEANFILGAYYDYGYKGLPRDESKAIAHYKRAKELGYYDNHDRLAQLTKIKKQN
jgi:hypothetical protein